MPQSSLVCVSISQQVRTPPQRDESLGRTSALEKVRVIAGQLVMWRWRMCGELVTASHWETLRLFSLVAEWSLERYFNPKWTVEKSWLVTNGKTHSDCLNTQFLAEKIAGTPLLLPKAPRKHWPRRWEDLVSSFAKRSTLKLTEAMGGTLFFHQQHHVNIDQDDGRNSSPYTKSTTPTLTKTMRGSPLLLPKVLYQHWIIESIVVVKFESF